MRLFFHFSLEFWRFFWEFPNFFMFHYFHCFTRVCMGKLGRGAKKTLLFLLFLLWRVSKFFPILEVVFSFKTYVINSLEVVNFLLLILAFWWKNMNSLFELPLLIVLFWKWLFVTLKLHKFMCTFYSYSFSL
jgi:hypothetical protein